MREFLISVLQHLSEHGWIVDNDFCLYLLDTAGIKSFFARKDNCNCLFSIDNFEFSYLIYKDR